MCYLVYILVGHVTAKRLIQFHQVLVYRFRLLPLLEYHYPYFVPHPWAKLILQPSLHAADSEVIYPTSQHLVQSCECVAQRQRRRPFPAQDFLDLPA